MPAQRVFIGVGSNIDPHSNVLAAAERLHASAPIRACSTFYKTRPIERPGQADFLNGILEVQWTGAPEALKFDVLRNVENELGRERTGDPHAARTIDLDIVLFGALVSQRSELRIPDPDIHTRAFIAIPLLELAPDLEMPDTGRKLNTLEIIGEREALTPDMPFTRSLKERLDL